MPDSPFRALTSSAGIGSWHWDPATGGVEWDATTEAIYGLDEGGFGGGFEHYIELVHPDDRQRVIELLERVGETGGDYSIEHRIVRPDGSVRTIQGQGHITVVDGVPVDGIGIVYDVTDRWTIERQRDEAEAAARAAQDSYLESRADLAFLIEAGDALSASLNASVVVERLLALINRRLAVASAIDLSVEHPVAWAIRAWRVGGHEAVVETEPRTAEQRRRLELAPDAMTDPGVSLTPEPELERRVTGLVPHVVPIVAGGRRVGTVVAWDHAWPAQRRELVESVVRRAGQSIDNAQLFADRSAVAEVIFSSINPSSIPKTASWDIAAHYRAATDLARVGGDFYDVIELSDGSMLLALGDICGKGAAAAAHAGLIRSSLRTAARSTKQPGEILRILNEVTCAEPGRPLVTACAMRLDLDGTVTVATAGHPPPLVMDSNGRVDEVDAKGVLLGFADGEQYRETTIHLDTSSAIVVFSDGVVESRAGSVEFGTKRLGEALARAGGASARSLVDSAVMEVEIWCGGSFSDDVAMVLARRR